MNPSLPQVFRNPDFRRFWSAVTVSGAGSYVTVLALPLTALTLLHASAAQLGLLSAAQLGPSLLVTPFAGVATDTLPAKAVNAICDAARGVLLLAVPVLAAADALTLGWLYSMSVLIGVFKALADVAHHSMLPRIVPTGQIVSGNAAVNASYSVTEVAGPGLAGIVVQAFTAPYAVILDAVSFLLSGSLIATLRTKDPDRPATRPSWPVMVRDGFVFLGREKPLLLLGLSGGVANFFIQAYLTIFVLYAVRSLHFSPLVIGGLYALGAVGGIIGAAVSSGLGRRISRVGAMVAGNVATGAGICVVSTAGLVTSGPLRVTTAVAGMAMYSLGSGIYNVHSMSARQQLCPADMLGRVTAGYRLLSHGTLPLGALAGGFAAQRYGQGWTIMLAGLCLAAWMGVVVFTPFRHLNARLVKVAEQNAVT